MLSVTQYSSCSGDCRVKSNHQGPGGIHSPPREARLPGLWANADKQLPGLEQRQSWQAFLRRLPLLLLGTLFKLSILSLTPACAGLQLHCSHACAWPLASGVQWRLLVWLRLFLPSSCCAALQTSGSCGKGSLQRSMAARGASHEQPHRQGAPVQSGKSSLGSRSETAVKVRHS